MNHKYSYAFALFLSFFTGLIHSSQIQSKEILQIFSYSTNQNYATEYTFKLEVFNSLLTAVDIEIEFPQGFGFESPCSVFLKTEKEGCRSYECKNIGSSVWVHVEKITRGTYQMMLENIRNPASETASSFKMRIYAEKRLLLRESESSESMVFLPFPSNAFFSLAFVYFV